MTLTPSAMAPSPSPTSHKNPLKASLLYESFQNHQITDSMLDDAAKLFSEHYGIWSQKAVETSPKLVPSSRVKMSASRLRAQCLPSTTLCVYARATTSGRLIGHTLACRWICNAKVVCWVTQLVVHSDYRLRGVASGLLNQIREDGDDIYGIASSHPAACLAAAKAFNSMYQIYYLCLHTCGVKNYYHSLTLLGLGPITYWYRFNINLVFRLSKHYFYTFYYYIN